MSAPRAVLWDMDGTLIDSEDLHWTAWRDIMANEGISITREQFLASFGQRNDSILPQWLVLPRQSRAWRESQTPKRNVIVISCGPKACHHYLGSLVGCTSYTSRNGCK